MAGSMKKAECLNEMERLYLQRAYSDVEIAERLGVDRTTAYRYRMELSSGDNPLPIDQDEHGKWKIARSRYLSNIRVNLYESLSLYLAARRASQQSRLAGKHTANALEKLALTLRQPMTARLVKVADRVLAAQANPARVRVFETVARGWAEQIPVRIRYRALHAKETREHLIQPFLVEPAAWSDSVYVIAHSDVTKGIIPFKIERIERASLSTGRFEIPADFDEDELLKHAWGIWRRDGEPQTVRLKFSPGPAARRLQESTWHPLETVTVHDDGGNTWEAPIADWREMLPWIRGWGADCEVLAPKGLRKRLEREVRRLARVYGVSTVGDDTPRYYAHSRLDLDEAEWQLLKDHLTATSELAADMGQAAGIAELARVAALLHDLGKYSTEFQARLRGSKKRADHATAGAREIVRLFPAQPNKMLAELLSFAIAGHHTGLPDYGSMGDMGEEGTLLARREKKKLPDYSAYQSELDISATKLQPPRLRIKREHPGYSLSFLTRIVFSTLVDADWLETERYMGGREKPRGQHATVQALAAQFSQHLERFENPQSAINRKRTETLHACIEKAAEAPGFFTLTVPTGGGKTLSSMAFALNHAKTHGLQRVIYVIPFTSIIEQNAAVFREALGEMGAENVLEHHSNFDWEGLRQASDDETNQVQEKLKLAAENWDIPIVVTTNVQFFESLFASKKTRARKLHNIAKSVIIFDEVQTLPLSYLKPCLLAVQELVINYGVSVVFCTATQPALERFFPREIEFAELAPEPQELFDFYHRVEVKNLGTRSDDEILDRLNDQDRALCIVNTRRHARGLYDRLSGDGKFHLSTLMCPVHRQQILAEIRHRLRKGEPCRVVSTSVMEAGIDVDFPVGYRALAGLDSIIQAAGRVNREMKRNMGEMFVFDPDTEFIKRTPAYIEQTGAVAQSVLREHAADPTTVEAIAAYYNMLYTLHDERSFDVKEVIARLDHGPNRVDFDFKTAAEDFRLIDLNTVSVIIPFDDTARDLIERLPYVKYPASLLRRLQIYTVNIYEREFANLQSKGVIQTVADAYQVLDETHLKTWYKYDTGLTLADDRGGDAIFFDG